MPDDLPVADASAPATCTFTPDELDMPVGLIEDLEGCSRPIWDGASSSRCVWHADGDDKPPDELPATVGDGELSGARVRESDLTDVPFPKGSQLIGADLSQSHLQDADLTDADLTGATLTNAELGGTDLTDADLREAKLSAVTLSRSTQCDNLPGLRAAATAADDPATEWDYIARTYHALKTAFAANGLVGRARDYHVLEQDAREREARATEGWLSQAYLGSKASRYLTGYGVRASRVGLIMVVLFGIATVVYLFDPGIENSLAISVITFTTSPPGDLPTHWGAQAIAMVETFVGTLLIVLLGYVLGNRERF